MTAAPTDQPPGVVAVIGWTTPKRDPGGIVTLPVKVQLETEVVRLQLAAVLVYAVAKKLDVVATVHVWVSLAGAVAKTSSLVNVQPLAV